MDFIKKMRKREFIEMTFKTIAAFLALFVVIILMEGMIYGIELKAIKSGSSESIFSTSTVAYAVKQKDDEYLVILYNESDSKNHLSDWAANSNNLRTKEEVDNLQVLKVIERAPNAFELSITWPHYIVMSVAVVGLATFYAFRFVKLNKSYKKIKEEFEKTGTIEITNM